MSDKLFTATVPSESGWFYVRFGNDQRDHISYFDKTTGYLMGDGGDAISTWGFFFGPRIPTPEQCAELNNKQA